MYCDLLVHNTTKTRYATADVEGVVLGRVLPIVSHSLSLFPQGKGQIRQGEVWKVFILSAQRQGFFSNNRLPQAGIHQFSFHSSHLLSDRGKVLMYLPSSFLASHLASPRVALGEYGDQYD
jgi:hypothetical protein